jgi:hypothetical protein
MDRLRKSKKTKMKKKTSFSKFLLMQESALIWVVTLSCLLMAFICIFTASFVELPWITAMVGCPWAAYAVSQHAYYKKSMAENTQGGIVYDNLFGVQESDCDVGDNTTEIPVG